MSMKRKTRFIYGITILFVLGGFLVSMVSTTRAVLTQLMPGKRDFQWDKTERYRSTVTFEPDHGDHQARQDDYQDGDESFTHGCVPSDFDPTADSRAGRDGAGSHPSRHAMEGEAAVVDKRWSRAR